MHVMYLPSLSLCLSTIHSHGYLGILLAPLAGLALLRTLKSLAIFRCVLACRVHVYMGGGGADGHIVLSG